MFAMFRQLRTFSMPSKAAHLPSAERSRGGAGFLRAKQFACAYESDRAFYERCRVVGRTARPSDICAYFCEPLDRSRLKTADLDSRIALLSAIPFKVPCTVAPSSDRESTNGRLGDALSAGAGCHLGGHDPWTAQPSTSGTTWPPPARQATRRMQTAAIA